MRINWAINHSVPALPDVIQGLLKTSARTGVYGRRADVSSAARSKDSCPKLPLGRSHSHAATTVLHPSSILDFLLRKVIHQSPTWQTVMVWQCFNSKKSKWFNVWSLTCLLDWVSEQIYKYIFFSLTSNPTRKNMWWHQRDFWVKLQFSAHGLLCMVEQQVKPPQTRWTSSVYWGKRSHQQAADIL